MGKNKEDKGYRLVNLSKHKAKKDSIFEKIEKYDSNIKQETRNITDSPMGLVYAITKKGIIYGIYLFEGQKAKEGIILNHKKTLFADEVSLDIRKKYDNLILEDLKDSVSYIEYDKVSFNDKIIQIDPNKTENQKIVAIIGGYLIGFALFWVLFEELYMGMLGGLIFATSFSGLNVVVMNKRGRKNNHKKNNSSKNE